PRVVRCAAVREHADLVHASAVRLRPLLPARHRAEDREELGYLSRRAAVGGSADHHGGHRHFLAGPCDVLDPAGCEAGKLEDRDPRARFSAAELIVTVRAIFGMGRDIRYTAPPSNL